MGAKHKLFKDYEKHKFFLAENKFDTFVDLFAGSCAVSFEVYKRYPTKQFIINDINHELIQMYNHIKENFEEFLMHYEKIKVSFLKIEPKQRCKLYYNYREKYANYNSILTLFDSSVQIKNNVEMSAILLVLMQSSFSGLWRTSKRGRFNSAPADIDINLPPLRVSNLYKFHLFLQNCILLCKNYKDLRIPKRSWLYADPPYRGRSNNDLYHDSKSFDDSSQIELVNYLQESNLSFAFSNLELGDGFWEENFDQSAKIHVIPSIFNSGARKSSQEVLEVLIKNY